MKKSLAAIAVIGALVGVAEAQVPTCEEQLAVSNQLLQDFSQLRGRAEYDLAQWKVKAKTLETMVADAKAKDSKDTQTKDHAK